MQRSREGFLLSSSVNGEIRRGFVRSSSTSQKDCVNLSNQAQRKGKASFNATDYSEPVLCILRAEPHVLEISMC
jgi:hypothetical protein